MVIEQKPALPEACGDNVLLVPVQENLTAGGLHLPENSTPEVPKGRVIGVGPDVENVAIGDIVGVGGQPGKLVFPLVYHGEDMLVVSESMILLKFPQQ